MSGDVESGSSRPRPLSGGFWTLLSWLRREEQSSSNESLSSAGSDRTAVSFAFLAPAHYHSRSPPVILPPPGPPTETYKKRVRDRNLRRQYDRDLTLHRKYGLFRGEGVGGYDAFSLPPARRNHGVGADRSERERRATSECYQRRAAHVPGKRRAPPPPRAEPALTVTRRHTRKRPAPQPPSKLIENSKENIPTSSHNNIKVIQMSSQAACEARETKSHVVSVETDCKPEKYTKKDLRDCKIRTEKSFLKQIFENKKRHSAVDVSSVKVLPSISELDKQAAEIIENKKIRNAEEINRQKLKETVVCSKCFKESCYCNKIDMMPSSSSKDNKNSSTMYTQTENDSLRAGLLNKDIFDEKQKLKNMLKEMKDSLPKRPKHENNHDNKQTNIRASPILVEREINVTSTPTLRIGSSNSPQPTPSSEVSVKNAQALQKKNQESPTASHATRSKPPAIDNIGRIDNTSSNGTVPVQDAIINKQTSNILNENKKLNTPLKISSLLNPIYVPRNNALLQHTPKLLNAESNNGGNKEKVALTTPETIYVKTADTVRDIILNSAISGNPTPTTSQPLKSCKSPEKLQQSASKEKKQDSKLELRNDLITESSNKNVNIAKLNEHSRRRELVNQLEQSIAKGDERAAADAATKLAQLRLSCSVLSFSSQILGEPSTSSAKITEPLISKKHTEPSTKLPGVQEPANKVLDSKKKSSATPLPARNDKKVTLGASSAEASTSKEMTRETVVDNEMTSIQIWIEDKEKARGPIQLHVRRQASVGDLRRQAEQSLGLPARLQRWIVGRALCANDNTLLISLAGPTLNAPFYLCLVENDTANNLEVTHEPSIEIREGGKKIQGNAKKKSSNVYSELVNLERQALVPNTETFECEICMETCNSGDGAVLRECVHSFCKGCLSDVIRHCEEPTVSCPATGCPGELHEREIRALVSAEEYQRWLARGLAAAESGTRNAFHCRTRDCTGWALCEIDVRRFPCPVCKHTNCVPCQAIHENETCEQYQAKLIAASVTNTGEKADEGTQALIDSLITRGEALQCPECSAVITKKWGCDWVKCSACKTEICWVTRGRRWGPGGRGDTSGGCRCGVDGKRCHPSCGYCH